MSTLTPDSQRVMDQLLDAAVALFRPGIRNMRSQGKAWKVICCHRGEESGKSVVASRRIVIARSQEEATAIVMHQLGPLAKDIVAVEQLKISYLRRMQR